MRIELLNGKLEKANEFFKTAQERLDAIKDILKSENIPHVEFFHRGFKFLGVPKYDTMAKSFWKHDRQGNYWCPKKNTLWGKAFWIKMDAVKSLNLSNHFCDMVGFADADRWDLSQCMYHGCGWNKIGDRLFLEFRDCVAPKLTDLSDAKEISALEYCKLEASEAKKKITEGG